MVPFNSEIRKFILRIHNTNRNFIAGGNNPNLTGACGMVTQDWGYALAETASYNVKKCSMRHDECYNTPKFLQPGQNLAEFGYNPPLNLTNELTKIFQAFYNEGQHVTQSHIHNCTFTDLYVSKFMIKLL